MSWYRPRGKMTVVGEPSADDKRLQEEVEREARAAADVAAKVRAMLTERGIPQPSDDEVGRILAEAQEQLGWQVRLFCGHIVEKRVDRSHRTHAPSAICPHCETEQAVLACRPLGP